MGFFTLTGNIADFTPYPIADFTSYQIVLEPISLALEEGGTLYTTLALGSLTSAGAIKAADGVHAFEAYTEAGLYYALRTLPELFPRIVFVAPAAGVTISLADIEQLVVPGTQVPGLVVSETVEQMIAAGDSTTLVAAKAYADTVSGSGFVGVGTNKITVSETAPADPVEGDLWLDTSA